MIALVAFQVRVLLRGRASIAALLLFGITAGVVSLLGLGSFRQLGLGAIGPAAAALVSVSVLLPTAQALLLGAMSYSGDRETGLVAMVVARGLPPSLVIVASWLAVSASAWMVVAAGYGVAAVVVAGNVPLDDLVTFAQLFGLMLLVAAASAAVGTLVGVLSQTRLQAALGAVAAWLALALGLDLISIGLGLFLRGGEPVIVASILADPIATARVAALVLLDGSGERVGAIGTYVVGRAGASGAVAILAAVVACWIPGSLLLASLVQRRRDL